MSTWRSLFILVICLSDTLAAAKQVLMLVQPQQAGMGKFTIQNNGPVQGQNIGDHQHITQHFGDFPKA